MKFLSALVATYLSVLFIAYLFGLYKPDGIIVGFALFFTAITFVDLVIEEARK